MTAKHEAAITVPTGGWSIVACVPVDHGTGAVTLSASQQPIEWTADDVREVLGHEPKETDR